ncbi:hypothetical protein AKJ16_DCAP12521 [Drosera capensis]
MHKYSAFEIHNEENILWKMRSRSSNQEHQLGRFSSSSSSPSFAATGLSNVDPACQHQLQYGNFQQQQQLLRPQQMTIFYEGSVSVCDVTELQPCNFRLQAHLEYSVGISLNLGKMLKSKSKSKSSDASHSWSMIYKMQRSMQARAIIGLAAKGAEERRTSSSPIAPLPSTSAPVQVFPLVSLPAAPAPPGAAPSIKRSLQLFLQKRNSRAQAAAPYNNR